MHQLYRDEDLNIMIKAEEVAGREQNRLEKIKQFALSAGYKKIGIAHCVSFMREAEILKAYLSDSFEVYTIDCKVGRHRKAEFFNADKKGMTCNPIGQADYLAEQETELNLSFGLCVGHDILFNQKSLAPVSNLFVKDHKTKHDLNLTIEAVSR